MTLLGSTKLGTTVSGHSELVGLAIEQLEMDGDAVLEDEMVDRFVQCATHALPYFSVCFDFSFNFEPKLILILFNRVKSNQHLS